MARADGRLCAVLPLDSGAQSGNAIIRLLPGRLFALPCFKKGGRMNLADKGPLCSKCKRPMAVHSVEIVKSGAESVTVFVCRRCDRLTGQAIENAGPVRGDAVG
jgi:hypothetical protein